MCVVQQPCICESCIDLLPCWALLCSWRLHITKVQLLRALPLLSCSCLCASVLIASSSSSSSSSFSSSSTTTCSTTSSSSSSSSSSPSSSFPCSCPCCPSCRSHHHRRGVTFLLLCLLPEFSIFVQCLMCMYDPVLIVHTVYMYIIILYYILYYILYDIVSYYSI